MIGFLVLGASPAAAKQKPVTGKLNHLGYTVVAVGSNGRATKTKVVRKPSFKLAPPTKRFTLQVLDPLGHYAGPVVGLVSKKLVVTGFKAGAKLGAIKVDKRRGYALARKPARAGLDRKRTAVAVRGVPIGAGRLGRVPAAASGATGRGLDPDRDGIPGVFDVDDDGDLLLDNLEAAPARAAIHDASDPYHAIWVMDLNLGLTFYAQRTGLAQNVAGFALNRNARNSANDDAAFDKASAITMSGRGKLLVPIPPGTGPRLGCAGLPYCGTARDLRETRQFPGGFSPDGDGFGLMEPVGSFNPINDGIGATQLLDPARVFGIKPGMDRTKVRAGQTLFEKVPGIADLQPISIHEIFATVPALAAWSDGGGQSTTVTYPVPSGASGTSENPAGVKPSPDGDYRMTLIVWRPQYEPEGSPGQWLDFGQLTYTVVGRTNQLPPKLWRCPTTAYTAEQPGQQITPSGVKDPYLGGPVDPAQVMKLTVNVSECLRFSGAAPWGVQDAPPSEIYVAASSTFGDAAEGVGFAFRGEVPPKPPEAFSGTWHFHDNPPGAQVDWTVQANQFSSNRFRIRVHNGFSIASGSTPPGGWTCTKQTVQVPDDAWACSGGTLAPGQPVSGSVNLNGSSGELAFEVIAPDAEGSPSDKGYPMTQG